MAEVWYTAPFGMIDWPWIALENHGWEVQWGAYGGSRRLGRLVSSAAEALARGPEFRRGSRVGLQGHLAECAVWRDYPYYGIGPAIAIVSDIFWAPPDRREVLETCFELVNPRDSVTLARTPGNPIPHMVYREPDEPVVKPVIRHIRRNTPPLP